MPQIPLFDSAEAVLVDDERGRIAYTPRLVDAPLAAIASAARLVNARTGVPFNSVGLNLYRDGRDSVAEHNDHLNTRTASPRPGPR